MAIVTDQTKAVKVLDDSFEANEDLSSSRYVVVSPVAAATGRMKVGLPGGQGVLPAGILQNAPASGEMAQVRELGASKVVANAAFNAGVELTVAATTGKVEAASSGDYVVAMAREAAKGANHEISCVIVGPYQKN